MTQTIKQLTARVRELEEEIARLKKHQCTPVCIFHEGDEREELKKQFTARIAELEEEKKELQALLDFDNARLDQIEDELEDVEYLGPYVEGIKVLKTQLAASQLHAEQLREALNQWIDIAANCSIQSGCCCCGDSMENHASPMLCGHSPVDMADSVVHSAIQQTDNALALPRDTSALDAYVAEKVKEAMK